MNHILQLQEDKARLLGRLRAIEESLDSFNSFLHSEKFAGAENDGSRKDWIATADVINWIRETKRNL